MGFYVLAQFKERRKADLDRGRGAAGRERDWAEKERGLFLFRPEKEKRDFNYLSN
jgi:hypothetical protein